MMRTRFGTRALLAVGAGIAGVALMMPAAGAIKSIAVTGPVTGTAVQTAVGCKGVHVAFTGTITNPTAGPALLSVVGCESPKGAFLGNWTITKKALRTVQTASGTAQGRIASTATTPVMFTMTLVPTAGLVGPSLRFAGTWIPDASLSGPIQGKVVRVLI